MRAQKVNNDTVSEKLADEHIFYTQCIFAMKFYNEIISVTNCHHYLVHLKSLCTSLLVSEKQSNRRY